MSSSLTYRPDIDGLRAVAVLGVLFYHAGFGVPGGYIGVDVFFVISGFLITSLLLKDLHAGTFSMLGFWERRARRILPALAVLVAVVLAAGWFCLLPIDYEVMGKQVIALALFSSNIKFWRESGYFDAVAEEKPLLHTWSLSVEEQFYLLIPLLLFLLFRWKKQTWVLPVIVGGAVISFLLSVYGSYRSPSATFYLLPARAWELAAGSLLAFAPPLRSSSVRILIAWLGVAGILLPYFFYPPGLRFPGVAALPPVAGAVALIWAGRSPNAAFLPLPNRILAGKPMVWIGQLSYSLYLWHWPIFAFQKYLNYDHDSWPVQLALLSASFPLAWLSLRFVERPFRSRKVIRSRAMIFGVSGAAVAGLLLCSLFIWKTNGVENRFSHQLQRIVCSTHMDRKYVRDLHASDIPENLTLLGRPNGDLRVFVWGDSHAMAILPVIDEICREKGVSGKAATHSATAPVLEWHTRSFTAGLGEKAPGYNASVVEYLSKLAASGNHIQLIMVAKWSAYLKSPEESEAFSSAMERTIALLRSRGINIVILKEVPEFDFNPPRALGVRILTGRSTERLFCHVSEYKRRDVRQNDIFEKLIGYRMEFIDPIPCFELPTGEVRPFDESGVLWVDSNHLSSHGSLRLKPAFEAIFSKIPTPLRGRRE